MSTASVKPAEVDDERGSPRLSDRARIEAVVRRDYPLMWRVARRFGLSEADAEDVAQQAVVVVTRRLAEIALGAERAFFCRTVVFLASTLRRNQRRRAEEPVRDWDEHESRGPDPERLLEQRRANDELDAILDELPEPLRAVFVLFEIELQSQLEVAEALQIPQGTVASRVRRARVIVARAIERRRQRSGRIGVAR